MAVAAPFRPVPFGRTGLAVSPLCAGTGTSGHGADSVQGRQSPEEFARVLVRAWELGIRFWDTAAAYGTHRHLAEALRTVPREEVVVATKTHAAGAAEAREAVRRSLEAMGLERVDVLIMHEVDTLEDLSRRRPAMEEMNRLRAEGRVGAVGLSTHAIDVLEQAAGHPDLQVVFTNYNFANLHMDAHLGDYERALERAFRAGQGVYVHKTLAEGRLADRLEQALRHNLTRPFLHSVCVGFTRVAEVEQVAALAAEILRR